MNYVVLAKYYDRMMGDRSKELEWVRELISKYCPQTKKVLELACGTGTFLKYLHEQGFDVTGVDMSPEMLAVARNKVPQALFLLQDIASFSLPDKFDVIVCLFDSINHLVEYADWEAIFSRVHLHLNEGGLFIFDINTQNALEQLAQDGPIVKEFDGKKMIMTVTSEHGIYNWNVKITEKGGGGEVISSEDIQEQSFPIQQIQDSLKKLFSKVIVINQNGDEASETSKRVYFICRIT